MATKVHMEALSPTMEEGQIVKWLKAEGEEVASGDILAEIETDKATMELVARGDGVLRAVLLSEGDTAAVGSVIGVIASADEDIDAIVSDAGGASTSTAAAEDSDGKDSHDEGSDGSGDEGETSAASAGQDSGQESQKTSESGASESQAVAGSGKSQSDQEMQSTAPTAGSGRVKASPLARRLAEEAGIDLGAVSGSGPGGRPCFGESA